MAAATFPEARKQIHEMAAAFDTTHAATSRLLHSGSLSDSDLQQVGAFIRAADTLLDAVAELTPAEQADLAELRALAGALRRMAYLVIVALKPDEAWCWTPEWQSGEREVDRNISAGRTTVYESEEAFEAALAAIDAQRPTRADL